LGALGVIVGADLAVDVGMRDHRHVLAREHLGDRVVVIGVWVRDQHAEKGFASASRRARKARPSDRSSGASIATTPSAPSTR
jgi:hypothetical protein